MLEFLLPYVIGSAMGLSVAGDMSATSADMADTSSASAAVETPAISSFGDDEVAASGGDVAVAETREPEPQIATGKYTTAVEIKAILGMTKTSWVAVRLFDGNDLVYFSHLLAWRCGLWEIRYGINGEPATNVVPMEPCREEFAAPNSLTDPVNFPVYITLPPESVESVYVEIFYDDGTTDFVRANRSDVLIP